MSDASSEKPEGASLRIFERINIETMKKILYFLIICFYVLATIKCAGTFLYFHEYFSAVLSIILSVMAVPFAVYYFKKLTE